MAGSSLSLGLALRPFLRWWLTELQGLVPPALRPRAQRPSTVVSLDPTPCLHLADGTVRPLNDADLPAQPVSLWLPERVLLRLEIDLPLAAEENLAQVLAFEMDRRTPFAAEAVCFDHRLLARDAKAGVLRVLLVVTPREVVAAALAQAEALGLVVARIEPEGGDVSIDLKPHERGAAQRDRLTTALQASAVLLAALAAVLPGERQRLRVQELTAQLAEVRPAGERAAALRGEVERLAEEARFLTERKLAPPAVVVVLDRLTALLPNDAWLTNLRLSDRSLTLTGYAKSASGLIPRLAESADFGDPRFNAPLIRDDRIGAERFDITVELRSRQP